MLERRLPDRFVSMADVQWLQEGGAASHWFGRRGVT
jgi:hypothetical protein